MATKRISPVRFFFVINSFGGGQRIYPLIVVDLGGGGYIFLVAVLLRCNSYITSFTHLVKSLSHVQLIATPWTTAYQAPPSMGFSRQEYWSGVLLPSPNNTYSMSLFWLYAFTHTCVLCSVARLCLTLWDPTDCIPQAPLSMGFPRQEHWSRLPFPSPGDLPNPAIEPESPELQADSSQLCHQGSPRYFHFNRHYWLDKVNKYYDNKYLFSQWIAHPNEGDYSLLWIDSAPHESRVKNETYYFPGSPAKFPI